MFDSTLSCAAGFHTRHEAREVRQLYDLRAVISDLSARFTPMGSLNQIGQSFILRGFLMLASVLG